MSNFIDVIIAVDAEDILDARTRSRDPGKPTLVRDKHVHVILKDRSGLKGISGPELSVRVSVGDVIRLRELPVSYGFEHAVVSYSATVEGHGFSSAVLVGGIRCDGTAMCSSACLPKQNQPTNPAFVRAPYAFWLTAVQTGGKFKCEWRFMIADKKGEPEGYFYWQPTIILLDGAGPGGPSPRPDGPSADKG